jgi:hypothetical protein
MLHKDCNGLSHKEKIGGRNMGNQQTTSDPQFSAHTGHIRCTGETESDTQLR